MSQTSLTGLVHAACVLALLAFECPSLAADGNAVAARDGGKVRLGNRRVALVAAESDGNWDATWLDGVDAALKNVRFAVTVDDQPIAFAHGTAETASFRDATGRGVELRQRWGKDVVIQRCLRIYDDRPAIMIAASIANCSGRDVKLGMVKTVDLSAENGGAWHLVSRTQAPCAMCSPSPETPSAAEQKYSSSDVLAFAQRGGRGGFVIGVLSVLKAPSSLDAAFLPGKGGVSLGVVSNLAGRILAAGQSVEPDPVWLSAEPTAFDALEHYGDAVAAVAPKPVRTGANALWCSWYPIRMTISEDIALAHGKIIAEHFKPLGLDVVQLDHGWQRGEICGNWIANERFPHGLKWLADELRSRYGLKLGLWIAPSEVAKTSRLFQDHPEWMVKDAQGQPATLSRWFWEPKPEMTRLNTTAPGVEKWIEETFARLSADGVGYYKIDFIAGAPDLRRAMEAIRRGAGPNAWIRYCQTPPLLSVGLASSSYVGIDTGDAGLAEWFDLARQNAGPLASSYWANDRLYHREICDMSVGRGAGVEEARFRLSLMTLGGCSISFSDDFRDLDVPRIRMMQQVLPPNNPQVRPLDLFERERPSTWHVHCKNASGSWDVVGLFNFDDQPQERSIELSALGLPANAPVVAFEFWEEKLLGVFKDRVAISLAPRTARVLLVRRLPAHPEIIATNMHILGGYHEIKRHAWDERQCTLSGRYERAAGLEGKAYVYVPDGYRPLPGSAKSNGSSRPINVGKNLWAQDVRFKESRLDWVIPFEPSSASN